jgi:hypothetical protein
MVYAADSKSATRKGLRVQVSSPAQSEERKISLRRCLPDLIGAVCPGVARKENGPAGAEVNEIRLRP